MSQLDNSKPRCGDDITRLTTRGLLSCLFVIMAAPPARAQWGPSASSVNFSSVGYKYRLLDESLPIIDFHKSKSIGPGVGCVVGVCGGFELWAKGDLDVDFDVHASLGGSYQMAYKANQVTGAIPLDPNRWVGTSFVLGTNLEPMGISKFNYQNNLAVAQVGLSGNAYASLGGEGCIAGCLGGSVGFGPFPFETDLIEVGPGGVDVLGQNVGSLPLKYTDPKQIITVTADLPSFKKSSGALPAGTGINYSSEQNIFKVNIDAAQALATAFGLPPMKGSAGPVDYTIVSANGWAGFNLRDQINLTPTTLATHYEFSAPVEVLNDATGQWSAPTKSLTIPSGQARTLRAPGAAKLGILPTYQLNVAGSTDMDLVAAVGYDVSALKVAAFGEGFGPLFSDKGSYPIATIDLLSDSLNKTVNTKGKPLTLDFEPLRGIPLNTEQTEFRPVTPTTTNRDGSLSDDYVLVLNATDPMCQRNPANCLVDRNFPVVPINFKPTPDPTYPVEFAEDFVLLTEILRAPDLVSGPSTTAERVVRQLAEQLGVRLEGPPTEIVIGPGYPPLTEPIVRSEFTDLNVPRQPPRGDFSGDGQLQVADLNRLTLAALSGRNDPMFDLTRDGLVDQSDRLYWVIALKGTAIGDANLDGMFNSRDFVSLFIAGEYEDAIPRNSTWETGDFDGDLDFKSSDMIFAFLGGGYERVRGEPAALSVPEPGACSILMFVALLTFGETTRRQRR